MKLHAFLAPACAAALLWGVSVPAFATTPTSVNPLITDLITANSHAQHGAQDDARAHKNEEIGRRR